MVQGDTASAPFGPGTGGSRSAVILSGAAELASDRVRDKMLEIAAHQLEAAPEDLQIEAGRILVAGTPARSMTVTDVARLAYLNPAGLPPGMEMGLEEKARYTPERPVHVVQLLPRLPVRGRSATRGRSRCCATSSARTAV